MQFVMNKELLQESKTTLDNRHNLFWIVGGAGSGKTTICQAISAQYDIPVYDMDAHIYGTYHGRFSQERHPVNTAWASAANGFVWLLDMSWQEFNQFNQAALLEYLDLLSTDLANKYPHTPLLIDGGICNPAIIAQVIPVEQIICLATPEQSSLDIWEGNEDRLAMKDMMNQMLNPEATWQKFLEFDANITQTILAECEENHIAICSRKATDSVDAFATKVATTLGIR